MVNQRQFEANHAIENQRKINDHVRRHQMNAHAREFCGIIGVVYIFFFSLSADIFAVNEGSSPARWECRKKVIFRLTMANLIIRCHVMKY